MTALRSGRGRTFALRIWFEWQIKDGALDKQLCAGLGEDDHPPPMKSARWYASQLRWHNASEEPTVVHENIHKAGNDLHYILEVDGIFFEMLELHDFPFDHQCLTVKLRANCAKEGKFPMRFIGLDTCMETVDVEGSALRTTWDLEEKPELGSKEWSPMPGRTYPMMVLTAHVNRRPGFYVFNVMVPISALTLAAFLQFQVTFARHPPSLARLG